MMHPALVAALAAERHADLLRAAESHRRARTVAAASRRTSRRRPADAFIQLVARFRAQIAASPQPQADLCCP